MKKQSLVLGTLVALAFAAHAEPKWTQNGWRVHDVPSVRPAAEVQQELAEFKKGPNPWSSSYNPMAAFHSTKTRAEVEAEYLANREAVAATTGQDGGSMSLMKVRAVAAPATAAQARP
jgi:hypothetical protein